MAAVLCFFISKFSYKKLSIFWREQIVNFLWFLWKFKNFLTKNSRLLESVPTILIQYITFWFICPQSKQAIPNLHICFVLVQCSYHILMEHFCTFFCCAILPSWDYYYKRLTLFVLVRLYFMVALIRIICFFLHTQVKINRVRYGGLADHSTGV